MSIRVAAFRWLEKHAQDKPGWRTLLSLLSLICGLRISLPILHLSILTRTEGAVGLAHTLLWSSAVKDWMWSEVAAQTVYMAPLAIWSTLCLLPQMLSIQECMRHVKLTFLNCWTVLFTLMQVCFSCSCAVSILFYTVSLEAIKASLNMRLNNTNLFWRKSKGIKNLWTPVTLRTLLTISWLKWKRYKGSWFASSHLWESDSLFFFLVKLRCLF